ncbi:MAG TPA: DUF6599 family protein [Candidatus Dormibacteraeota bacterium]|nr:DUF6599 family protein [Candidatus Dormibacteraeota bacterium]
MNRFLRISIAILFFAAIVPLSHAQTVLPSSFGKWTASSPSTMAPLSGLDQFFGPQANAFREYVVKSIEQRSYIEGKKSATITLYRLRDPSSAYGAYTFLRNDSFTTAQIGSFAGVSRDRALIVVGQMLLDITVPAKHSRPPDADLKQLSATLNKVADHTPYPTIGEHLPEKGRLPDSVHYVLGPLSLAQFVPIGTDDWIGFDDSAEAILAKYRVEGKDETLLIASYPTQQIAAMKFDAMLRRFVFDPPGGVPPGKTILFGKRVSSIVAVVVGAASQQAANKLLDQVTYESSVTWNEPQQSYTEPPFSDMIVGAFVGSGIIMFFAIVAGVAFGGLRILIKIVFPNKVFDRTKQIEILQLGISSKPINAKDFYSRG